VIFIDPATDAEIYLEHVLIASLEPTTPPTQPTPGPQTGGNS
jgi:hypothetical protein